MWETVVNEMNIITLNLQFWGQIGLVVIPKFSLAAKRPIFHQKTLISSQFSEHVMYIIPKVPKGDLHCKGG